MTLPNKTQDIRKLQLLIFLISFIIGYQFGQILFKSEPSIAFLCINDAQWCQSDYGKPFVKYYFIPDISYTQYLP